MSQGVIRKALSGFYYVDDGRTVTTCRARGKHRHAGVSPLVGDRVRFTPLADGSGALDEILPRKNEFYRPAVANIDLLVVVASQAVPVTDPFLIDRVAAIAAARGCETLICVNKCDLESGDGLAAIYEKAGFPTLRVSAQTGEGLDALRRCLAGKVCAFTGNSGVGKSSILNALEADFDLATGEISDKLGRGRHTTRHVELYRLDCGGEVIDTPGFGSFDAQDLDLELKEHLPESFLEFRPYLDQCRFVGCSHTKEKGCAVLRAVKEGKIPRSRHESYVRLYNELKDVRAWSMPRR